jgi:hypothetical protein
MAKGGKGQNSSEFENRIIGDNISTESSNVKININNVCNLISVLSERFN